MAEEVRVNSKGLFDEGLRKEWTAAAGLTVAEVIASLALAHSPGVAALVNGRLVDTAYVLEPGDELLLVEMIGGGQ